ncbi:hypothetical protein PoB_003273600 [Plakobranchus ocellatus]|uniref:Uncharacterized protein n=1 Tax=Plakobranchus ocellatus TaxID=259542 RepID=A0AAV4ACY3_9GAST|nr:hypothetical protein PoB_003273600 [Plakobranchus ocellatus]
MPNSSVPFSRPRALSTDSTGEATTIYNQIPERQRQQIVAWARRSRLNNWMRKKTSSLTNGYAPGTLPSSGKSSTFLKQQAMAGSTSSLPHATVAAGGAATLPRRDSRDTDIMLSRTTEGVIGPVSGGSTNATTFHLGPTDTSIFQAHERTHSNVSMSMVSPILSNGHHHHPHHHHQQHLRAPYGQSLSHPPFHLPSSASSPHVLAAGSSTNSLTSGGVSSNNIIPHRSSNKMFASASGNHLAAVKHVPLSAVNAPHGGKNSTTVVNGNGTHKQGSDDTVSVGRQESSDSNGNMIMYNTNSNITRGEISLAGGVQSRPQAQSMPVDNSDRMSLDSMPRGYSKSARSRLDRTPELDLSSLETDSVYSSGVEGVGEAPSHFPSRQEAQTEPQTHRLEKKSSKRKKFLPNFLQKGKGKQKTS